MSRLTGRLAERAAGEERLVNGDPEPAIIVLQQVYC
jgi:hypothetical protein